MTTVLWIVIGAGLIALAAYRFLPRYLSRRGKGADSTLESVSIDPGVDRRIMAIVVSVAVGGAALYMILSKGYAGESEKWAFGAVGTVVGFWLRPEKS